MRILSSLLVFFLMSCASNTNYGSDVANQIYKKFPETKNSLLYYVYYEDDIISYNLYVESENKLVIIKYENNEYTNPLNESIPNNIADNIRKCNIKLENISISPLDAINKSNEDSKENTALFSIESNCIKRWYIYNRNNDTTKVFLF